MAEWSAWEKVPGIEYKELLYEKKYRDRGGAVVRISFNRPQRMNALTQVGWDDIMPAIHAANLDKDVGVIVFTGVGDHFGVGGDVEWEAAGGLEEIGLMRGGAMGDGALKNFTKPIIAAVKGYCIGGHHHFAYHCDFTIASHTAIFGQNGPRVASPAHGHIVSQLAFVVGIKRAKEIWMLCRRYTAQEALQMGLVNAVVPISKVEEEVDKWCDELLDLNPDCLAIVKQSFESVGAYLAVDSGRILSTLYPDFFERENSKEAQQAFFEKRLPNFWKDATKTSS